MNNTKRFLLKIWYIGTNFFGSQRQLKHRTVEGELIRILKKFNFIESPTNARIQSMTRTDTGVHARTALFAFSTNKSVYFNQLASHFPSDMGLLEWIEVNHDFNPRYHIIKKEYRYFFFRKTTNSLNIQLMEEAAKLFEGEHDFYWFYKRDPTRPNKSTILKLERCRIEKDNDSLTFHFVGRSFLWQQIRRMVSSLLDIGNGLVSLDVIEKQLQINSIEKKIQNHQKYVPAPPDGLILWDFVLDEDIIFKKTSKSQQINQLVLQEQTQTKFQQFTALKSIYNNLEENSKKK